jgi:hypothetical protein
MPGRFDEEFRNWNERPPATPAARAADEIVARLPDQRSSWMTSAAFTAAAAIVVLLVGLAAWFAVRDHGPGVTDRMVVENTPSAPTPLSARRPVPLDPNVVLWWIDPDTPVYFVLQPQGGDSR